MLQKKGGGGGGRELLKAKPLLQSQGLETKIELTFSIPSYAYLCKLLGLAVKIQTDIIW